ncbi:uncharacterized protein BDR25DRAFT_344242 [Lindgomyces ingoldianus]|uniref:Uncharacterized protein n=1 Tax=Lindgomyces ingoldianus TaxID=673940 RepID=A0ACB6QNQ8_9PLEO|nr:uncharacterized protein BDR25DRAFT_344242 [Lindgomyces ingoldianus]KAF2468512.1 hypothetical protein BDR25DRAFT_344242 [Lindgomyces ingoldianus]
MPEPISICAGALGTVANAIDLSVRTYTLIEGIKSAPENIKRLAVELRSLYHVLGMLSQTLEAQRIKNRPENLPVHMISNTKELLENCIEVFREVETIVQPFVEADGSVLRSFRTGIKWEVGRKASINTLQKSLSNNKATLELAISTLNFFNSSQTIDMISDLQRDVHRLRRQIYQPTQHQSQPASMSAHERTPTAQIDAHSIPMQRFLARTASVASRVSTSTQMTELDSIFSEDISETTEVTILRDVDMASSERVSDRGHSEDADKDLSVLEHAEGDNAQASKTEVPASGAPEKRSTWKKIRKRMKRNDSRNILLPLPEAGPNATPHTTPSVEYPRVSETLEGERLVKSISTPIMSSHELQMERDSTSLPHRSRTTPITTLSALQYRDTPNPEAFPNSPYHLPNFNYIGKAPNPDGDSDGLCSTPPQPPTPKTIINSPSETAQEPDPSTPCTACKSPASRSQSISLKGSKYHHTCFRCRSCNILLQSASPPPEGPFQLKGDFLVCNSCAFTCQKCDERIEEHGPKDAPAYSGIFGRGQMVY